MDTANTVQVRDWKCVRMAWVMRGKARTRVSVCQEGAREGDAHVAHDLDGHRHGSEVVLDRNIVDRADHLRSRRRHRCTRGWTQLESARSLLLDTALAHTTFPRPNGVIYRVLSP